MLALCFPKMLKSLTRTYRTCHYNVLMVTARTQQRECADVACHCHCSVVCCPIIVAREQSRQLWTGQRLTMVGIEDGPRADIDWYKTDSPSICSSSWWSSWSWPRTPSPWPLTQLQDRHLLLQLSLLLPSASTIDSYIVDGRVAEGGWWGWGYLVDRG